MNAIDNELKLTFAQLEREQQAFQAGAENYRAAYQRNLERGDVARTTGATVLSSMAFARVADAIATTFRTAAPAAKASLTWGEKLGAEKCAHIAMTHMFNGIGASMTAVANRIGRQVRAELNALALEEGHPGLAHYVFEQIKKSRSARHKAAVLNHAKNATGTPDLKDMGFDDDVLALLGIKLVHAVIEHSGVFSTKESDTYRFGKAETSYVIGLTKEAQEAMRRAENRAQWMQPVRPLMLVKPRDWDSSLTGGYLKDVQRLELLKGSSTAYLQDTLASAGLDKAFSAMNTLQSTGFRINRSVLDVALEAWELDLAIGCIPRQALKEVPTNPAEKAGIDVDTFKATQPEAWKAWKKEASAVHAYNESDERVSKLLDMKNALDIAREHVEFDAFYMPVQMDFRTRMYYVPNGLNPQSHDLAKGLLEFSEGVRLTEQGARSLAIAGATIWANGGLDKKPLAERAAWVEENSGIIKACARDPLSNLWWTEADGGATAWSFLAFCFEWEAWSRLGEDHVSHIICFADGKANGSQHHAALMRAEEEAHYVCMVKMEQPDDLYSRVLDKVQQKLEAGRFDDTPFDKKNEDDIDATGYLVSELCDMVAGKLKRAHVKRACMTFSYGVTPLGIRDQLKADHKAFWSQFPKDARKPLVSMVAGMTLEAIKETVFASAVCMKYLQQVAKAVSKADAPINWTTPDGFPVQQRYEKYDSVRVRTVVSGGMRVRIDRTEQVRRAFFKGLGEAVKKVCKDKLVAKQGLSDLHEMLSYGVFADLTAQYREMVAAGNDAEFVTLVDATVADMLAGETLTKLREPMVELLLDAMVSTHEHKSGDDGKMSIFLGKATGKLDTAKQANAMAPNFIHSLDATHLRMTVNACREAGITNFAAVHDSFGCHAEHYADMNRILREQFVKMYSENDPLADLLETAKNVVPEADLPALPAKGTLDISAVLDADFFFA